MRLLALLAVAACAHTPNLPLRPDPSPPAGSTTETITARDGTQLLARHWAAVGAGQPGPDGSVARGGDARGVVVIMHGLKDYSARYASLASRLAAGGYSVYAFDLRGHGRSAGPRVAPDAWTDYVDDLDRFLTTVEQREPGKPIFLFGHSMGGAIAARTAELHQPALAGLVLSGPALAIDAAPLLISATRLIAVMNPRAPALKLPNGDFSSDPAAATAMDKDELVSQSPGPARTAAGLVDGMRAIWADVDRLTMPLLALHGTADRLTAPSGSRALVEHAPAQDKTLRIYAGFFHDLLHEPKRDQVEADIHAWLDAHTGGAAVAAPPIYAEHLNGDPRGWTQAIEFAGGISRGFDEKVTRFGGELAINLARPRPFGWHGAFTARLANTRYAVALKPLGVAARFGGAVFGLSGGGALLTDAHVGVAAGGWYEQPAGPLHLGIRADYEHAFFAGARNVGFLVGSLRFGGDRAYWPHARAGVGPIVSGGYECQGDTCGFTAMLGLQLYGAD
ncbi:MAG TPA: alpha/beta hydrolase [Kofleriaceae bacterium]|nr:alpha/beta hydrolase [Kofleriaceae bacterium]